MESQSAPAEFYHQAEQRSIQMFENVRKRRRERGRNVAILVAGGFHTDYLRGLIKDRANESFAIVAPKLGKDYGDQAKYRDVLLNTYVPMASKASKST